MEDQNFGSWLRASQFNPSRKTVVEVKGFSNLQHSTNFSERYASCLFDGNIIQGSSSTFS